MTDQTKPNVSFFGPEFQTWKNVLSSGSEDDKDTIKQNKEDLRNLLLSSMQMQHVMVLAGSGTSLGASLRGPSMWDIWDHSVNSNPNSGDNKRARTLLASQVIERVRYTPEEGKENIEELLSQCEAYLQISVDQEVATFIVKSKEVILNKCSEFLSSPDKSALEGHRTFLHRLSRRRPRDSRLKIFTTNYDLSFEIAAADLGLVVLDGFSFSHPRSFDPRFFFYDIVRRPSTGEETGTPLEGVFHLYKLHGSVNWSRNDEGKVQIVEKGDPDRACLIYPAKGKYQQSYVQPHLELMAQYFSNLRQPNTCIIVAGFGFNDDHLSEPILAAVNTNPHLRLIIVNPSVQKIVQNGIRNKFWDQLYSLASHGEDVWLINASFVEFGKMIPDLKSLSPAQKLVGEIKSIAGSK